MQEDGLVVVVKRDCPTCTLVAPVLAQLAAAAEVAVYSQDDPGFPDDMDGVIDDLTLAVEVQLTRGKAYRWSQPTEVRLLIMKGLINIQKHRCHCLQFQQLVGLVVKLPLERFSRIPILITSLFFMVITVHLWLRSLIQHCCWAYLSRLWFLRPWTHSSMRLNHIYLKVLQFSRNLWL